MQHPDVPKDAAVARPSPTFDDVDHALDLFRESRVSSRSPLSLVSLWSGTPVLLQYVSELGIQQQAGKEISSSISLLQTALNDVCAPGQPLKIGDGVLRSSFAVFQERSQAALLAKGLFHAVRAVVGTDQQTGIGLLAWNSQPQDFAAAIADLKLTFEAYHSAWELHGEPISGLVRERIATPTDDVATSILDEFAVALNLNNKTEWYTTTNWLIVRRLLSYLLTPAANPETRGHENRMRLLAAAPVDPEGKSFGTVLTATTQAYGEGHGSLYFDPVTSGLMTIDDDLRTCLSIADQIISSERSRDTSLRIEWPAETTLPNDLTGDSGGGLLVVSAVASSRKVGLDAGATASFAIHLKSSRQTTKPRLDDYCIAPVGGIRAKLTNNRQLGSIQRVYLCAGQTLDPHGTAWDDWVPTIASKTRLTILPVGTGDPLSEDIRTTLANLIHEMTGDERMEKIIRRHAHRAKADWANMLSGTSPEDHKLETHVEPRLSVELRPEEVRARRKATEKDHPNETDKLQHEQLQFETLPPGLVLFRQRYIGEEWNWILITERAGGGKTVLSWQLRSTLSDGDRPYFVVRYENSWPADLRSTLEKEIKQDCPKEITPQEAVDWLLENKRIVVIFDALDQVSVETAELLTRLYSDPDDPDINSQSIRVIVTSRPEAVNRWPEGFHKQFWRHFHLEEFDEQQRKDYVNKFAAFRERTVPGEGARILELWKQVTANQIDADVISLPNNLREIRLMIEEHLDEGTALRAFRTAGDLRWETAYRNLSRDPFKGRGKRRDNNLVTELIRAAACLAFELLRQTGTYIAQGDDMIHSVKSSAKQRFGGSRWEECDSLLRDSLTSGAAVLRRNNREELSFPSQKTMEFFAGLYLARYADQSAIQELLPLIGHAPWNEAWNFTIEMPLTTNNLGDPLHKADALQGSLSALFSQPVDVPRPTQLMFRAWQIMERIKFPERQAVLESYRQQFLDILSGTAAVPSMKLSEGAAVPTPLNRAQRAAEVITERDLWEHVRARRTGTFSFRDLRPDYVEQLAPLLGKQNAAEVTDEDIDKWFEREGDQLPPHLRPAHSAYAFCSNATSSSPSAKPSTDKDQLTFLMGASLEDEAAFGDGQSIQAFQMATCCVTRAQYRLFDPHRERDVLDGEYGISQRSPDDDCPITHVDWWDAFCFALWLGEEYQLPNELQWEGAAWGGIDRDKHREAVVSVPPYDAGFTSNEVNHYYPIEGQKKSGYARRTLPVRWDEDRRMRPLSTPKPDQLPNAYKANGFGLWHVNGNVWEWCESGWADTLKAAIDGGSKDVAKEDVNSGTRRVVRGGCWDYDAWNSRTSLRNWYYAVYRNYNLGFRLSRTRSN